MLHYEFKKKSSFHYFPNTISIGLTTELAR